MGKGRPGGNPELKNYRYSSDRVEQLGSRITLRLESSVFETLKEDEEWQNEVRRAIAGILYNKGELSEDLIKYYGFDN